MVSFGLVVGWGWLVLGSLAAILALCRWFGWLIWDSLWALVEPYVTTFMGLLLDTFPPGPGEISADVLMYLEYANFWIPLDLGVELVISYWAFSSTFIALRIAKGWLPGVS